MPIDFEKLKNDIISAIYQNGEELITGQTTQDVLIEIANALETADSNGIARDKVATDAIASLDEIATAIQKKISEINGSVSLEGDTFYYNEDSDVNHIKIGVASGYSAYKTNVKAKDVFFLNTQVTNGGLNACYYIVGENNLILDWSGRTDKFKGIIEIPEGGKFLYANYEKSTGGTFELNILSELGEDVYKDSLLQKGDVNGLYNYLYWDEGGVAVIHPYMPNCQAVKLEVSEGERYYCRAQSSGLARAYYLVDSSMRIIAQYEKEGKYEGIITIPSGVKYLLVNNEDKRNRLFIGYINDALYTLFSGISKNAEGIDEANIAIGKLYEYTSSIKTEVGSFYYNDAGSIDKVSKIGPGYDDWECYETEVKEGDLFYLKSKVDTGDSSVCYITNSSGKIIFGKERLYNYDGYIKIPAGGTRIYISYTNTTNFGFVFTKCSKSDEIIKSRISLISGNDISLIKGRFYYKEGGKVRHLDGYDGYDSQEFPVKEGQEFYFKTHTLPDESAPYYIVNASGNIIEEAPNPTFEGKIKIPSKGVRLYINFVEQFVGGFEFCELTTTEKNIYKRLDSISFGDNKAVRNAFPKPKTYLNVLRDKCPKFFKAMYAKDKDVVVCCTGTSLTQGNLYTSERPDASVRPPLMHGYDLVSQLFDTLIPLWSGQKYRRYDNPDLKYSASSWEVSNGIQVGGADIWDDRREYKNGLTKTTISPNASVSIVVPKDAWQFNFIYRTDSQGGNCNVSIAEGDGKMEVFNGSSWVEANGYSFSMLESPAVFGKGNTCYQKRLKMRCKNKSVGGINSIGSIKNITISKGNDSSRFNVVGFEWSPREFMFTIINGARGSHQWGVQNSLNLEKYQDTDIWEFKPDLIVTEVTTINWGGGNTSGVDKDPLVFVNNAKRAYFNEFGDDAASLYEKSDHYSKCEIVFYGDTIACGGSYDGAWNLSEGTPKFGEVTQAASNGNSVDDRNIGRVKNIFENYQAVEEYMLSKKDYVFIPVIDEFKKVADKYYGNYLKAFTDGPTDGPTLQYAFHLNDNGASLWGRLICPLFEL